LEEGKFWPFLFFCAFAFYSNHRPPRRSGEFTFFSYSAHIPISITIERQRKSAKSKSLTCPLRLWFDVGKVMFLG
jgi:hypothetical protein